MQTQKTQTERSVEFELEIDAPPEVVWKALTDADELMRWFPFQARVEPGPGGHIWLSWDGSWENSMVIRAWRPGERLRLDWSDSPEGSTAVDYFLDSAGRGTVLRLVHHGFSADEDWDEMYDSVRRGWSYELQSLIHYLENFRGRDRLVVRAQRELSVSPEQAWRELLSPRGLLAEGSLEGLTEGDHYSIVTVDGDRLSGEVRYLESPTDAGLTVDNFGDSLFRLTIERCGEHDAPLAAQLWLSSWASKKADVQALANRWQRMLTALFPA